MASKAELPYICYRKVGRDFSDDKVELEDFADSIDPIAASTWFVNAMEGATEEAKEAAEEKKRRESSKS